MIIPPVELTSNESSPQAPPCTSPCQGTTDRAVGGGFTSIDQIVLDRGLLARSRPFHFCRMGVPRPPLPHGLDRTLIIPRWTNGRPCPSLTLPPLYYALTLLSIIRRPAMRAGVEAQAFIFLSPYGLGCLFCPSFGERSQIPSCTPRPACLYSCVKSLGALQNDRTCLNAMDGEMRVGMVFAIQAWTRSML